MFNICSKTNISPPSYCINRSYIENQGSAYKVDENNFCSTVAFYDTLQVDTIDDDDPSRGLVLHYTGDWCDKDQSLNSTFYVRMVCSNDAAATISPTILTLDEDGCEHAVTISSQLACPSQCEVNRESGLCSNRGLCSYDADANISHCFCDEGSEGSDCALKVTKPMDGDQAVLAVLFVVLLSLVIMAGVGAWRVLRWRVSREQAMGEMRSSVLARPIMGVEEARP